MASCSALREMIGEKQYDVFLCYNGSDQKLARELAGRLRHADLSVFLASQEILPGALWQEKVERHLSQSRSCIVCLGPAGLSPWMEEEIRVAIDRSVKDRSFPVIPVLLPGAQPAGASQSPFLLQRQMVDLRGGLSDETAFEPLLRAIRDGGDLQWLPTVLAAEAIEIRATPACRSDPLAELLLTIAEDLLPRSDASRTVLVLTSSGERDGPLRAGVYTVSEDRQEELLHRIEEPASEALFRLVAILALRNSARSAIEHRLETGPPLLQALGRDLYQRIQTMTPTFLGDFLTTLDEPASAASMPPAVSVGAPRSDAGLGTDEPPAESDPWIASARLAVDRQDYVDLEQILDTAPGRAMAGAERQAEIELYGSLLAARQGNPVDVRDRLLRACRAAPPEARLRTACGFLQQGRTADASLLVETEDSGSSPVLHLFAEAVRLWIGAASPVSAGSQIALERLDELVSEASSMAVPTSLWLCFARLALKLGDPDRASRWLQKVGSAAQQSVDFLHVAALTALRSVMRRRLENPYRALPEEDRGRLVQAAAWLQEAYGILKAQQSLESRSDLVRDLATASELLAGVYEGAERERQFAAAAEAYEQAAAVEGGLAHLWARAGRSWLAAGHPRQAVQAFQRVPEELLALTERSDLAAALLLHGEPRAALETIAGILNQEVAPWQALFNAAIVLHLSGHSVTAAQTLEQARAKAGRFSWRVEALRGVVSTSLQDSENAEDAYHAAIYARGAFDLQLHQAYSSAFQAGTERALRHLLSRFRDDFRHSRAKAHPLDHLEKELKSTVATYRQRLEDLESHGTEASSLLVSAVQEAFTSLDLLRRKLGRLKEIDTTRDHWPAEVLIESVCAVVSGPAVSEPLRSEGTPVPLPETSGFDWNSLHHRAGAILADLPVETTLVFEDRSLLEKLCTADPTEEEAHAHRLAITARIFEISTSTPLLCYQSLAGEEGKSAILHKAYQERAIQRVFNRMQGRAILADEVGLGKTVEAGLILTEYRLRRLVRRCLVLVPTKDLAQQWHRELKSKLGHQPPHPWRVGRYSGRQHTDWTRYDTWIATYQGAILNEGWFLATHWDLVIADEAHHLIDRSTQYYKFLKNLRSTHLLLLTATPMHHSADDLFSLLSIVRPGLFGSLRAFRVFFSEEALADRGQRGTLTRILSQVLIRNTILAVADQVFTGRRVFKNIPVQLNEGELFFYQSVTNLVLTLGKAARRGQFPMEYYAIAKMASSSARATFHTIERMARRTGRDPKETLLLRRWCHEQASKLPGIDKASKIRVVEEILKEIAPRKALIFAEFRETALEIEAQLGIPAIHSGIDQKRREAMIAAFETSEEQRAIVATKGLAEGINLAFCSVLINYDLPWNPMRIEQRIGRIQRIGQHHPEVLIYSLAAAGTIEEEIRDALMRKVELFRHVVGDIGLDLASVTDGRIITAKLRAILREATSLEDLRSRVQSFFAEVMPPSFSEDPL